MTAYITLSSAQLGWAAGQLNSAMQSNKNRLKDLTGSPSAWHEAQCAAYIVGANKRRVGSKPAADAAPALFGWVQRNEQLAAAASILSRHMLGFGDIETVPEDLLAQPGAIRFELVALPETIDLFA